MKKVKRYLFRITNPIEEAVNKRDVIIEEAYCVNNGIGETHHHPKVIRITVYQFEDFVREIKLIKTLEEEHSEKIVVFVFYRENEKIMMSFSITGLHLNRPVTEGEENEISKCLQKQKTAVVIISITHSRANENVNIPNFVSYIDTSLDLYSYDKVNSLEYFKNARFLKSLTISNSIFRRVRNIPRTQYFELVKKIGLFRLKFKTKYLKKSLFKGLQYLNHLIIFTLIEDQGKEFVDFHGFLNRINEENEEKREKLKNIGYLYSLFNNKNNRNITVRISQEKNRSEIIFLLNQLKTINFVFVIFKSVHNFKYMNKYLAYNR